MILKGGLGGGIKRPAKRMGFPDVFKTPYFEHTFPPFPVISVTCSGYSPGKYKAWIPQRVAPLKFSRASGGQGIFRGGPKMEWIPYRESLLLL